MTGPTVRVAILADTHGFLDPRIAERIRDCEFALHAGDVGGADVLSAMQPGQETVAIRGNNDDTAHWAAGEHDTLAALPTEATVTLPGGSVRMVHGDDGGTIEQRHRRYRREFSDCQAVVYGHSHRPCIDQTATPWVLNPGAAGRTRTNGGPGCLLLHCDEAHWALEALRFEPRPKPRSRRRPGRPAAESNDRRNG
jgi:putative phosphoesterase